MSTTLKTCELAAANVRHGIDAGRRFPRNVFVGEWSDFFFFDSDWMREGEFVARVKTFLGIDRGTCAFLANLDLSVVTEASRSSLSIRGQTAAAEYEELLSGQRPGTGWLDSLDRLACASDIGEWGMYCEPANEIAVVGFRRSGDWERYRQPMAQFHAARFDDATRDPPLSYGFSIRALSSQWRDQFRREYALRPLPGD